MFTILGGWLVVKVLDLEICFPSRAMLSGTKTCSRNLTMLTHGLETNTSLFTKLTTHGFFLIKNKIKLLQHVAKYSKN